MSKRINIFQKRIDLYFGFIFLRLISFFKKKKSKKYFRQIIKKKPFIIGILRENALGDTLLISSILQEIKFSYPNCRIILFLGKNNSIMGPHLPIIDKLEILNFLNPLKAFIKLKQFKLDIIIDTAQWSRISAIIALLSKAKYSIGFNTENQYRHYIYDKSISHSNKQHEIENFRSLLTQFQIKKYFTPKLINLTHLPAKIKNFKKPYIIVHMWASGTKSYLREWQYEKWLHLLRWKYLKQYFILLTGSPDDFSKNEIFSNNKNIINIANQYNFSQTLSILKNASLCISINTGIMHITDAFNIPTISLNGPTNPMRWGALNKNSISLIPQINGCNFLNLGFEYKNQREDCMHNISLLQVKNTVKKLLK